MRSSNVKASVRHGDSIRGAHRDYINLQAQHIGCSEEKGESCCGESSYLRNLAEDNEDSMVKKVISFSLYGVGPKYIQGALRNARLQPVFFPGWTCRFYVSCTVSNDIICALRNLGSEVEIRTQRHNHGKFWRFIAAADPSVDVCIVRDADSRLSARDRAVVDAWLASDRDFHIIRDHPQHGARIMGGLWGARNGIISDIDQLISQWSDFDSKRANQTFLKKEVYPRVRRNALVHSEHIAYEGEYVKSFPVSRSKGEFLGAVIPPDRDDLPLEQRLVVDRVLQAKGLRIIKRPRRSIANSVRGFCRRHGVSLVAIRRWL